MTRLSFKSRLKERCVHIRTALLDAGVMSEADIAEFWPGGAANPDRDVDAWMYTHFNLARFSARAEARQEYADGAHTGRSDQLLNLQMGLPKVLPLVVPLDIDGEIVRVGLVEVDLPCLQTALQRPARPGLPGTVVGIEDRQTATMRQRARGRPGLASAISSRKTLR